MTAPVAGRNAADLAYLEATRAHLRMVMQDSATVSRTAHDLGSRTLAREALMVQTAHLERVVACLVEPTGPGSPARRADPFGGPPPGADPTAGLPYADRLRAHGPTATAAARAELVAGFDPTVRAIAEDTLRAMSRQLTALDLAAST